jgi:hypothetical protein
MKILDVVIAMSLGLVVLIVFEGMLTFGSAFNFENYTMFGWIFQGILVVLTLSISIKCVKEATDDTKA